MKHRFDISARRSRAQGLRARFRRGVVGLWIACVAGAMAGIPFAEAGVNMGTRLISGFAEPQVVAGGIETTESATSLMRFRTVSFKTRPTPEPTPTPEPEPEEETVAEPVYVPPAGSITDIIYAAAAEFGLDGAYLASIASCESGLNPQATNPAGYYGLFQFDQGTWAAYGYGSIYDATAQARTAARLIAAGQASRWPSCA